MTDQHSVTRQASTRNRPDGPRSGLLRHGVVGGLVGVLVSFLPFSTLLGGATAGYLHGGSTHDGALTGAVAAVVMVLPALVGGLAVSVLSAPVPGPELAPVTAAALAVGFVVFYVFGPAVVGGFVGATARRRGWFE